MGAVPAGYISSIICSSGQEAAELPVMPPVLAYAMVGLFLVGALGSIMIYVSHKPRLGGSLT